MKVLHVCNTDFYARKFLVPVIREQRLRGLEIEVLCSIDRSKFKLDEFPCPIHAFDFPQSPNPWSFLSAIRRLTLFLKRSDFAGVVSHNRNASIVGRVAAKCAGVNANIYTAHGAYFHDGQSRLARRAAMLLERVLARITTHCLSQSSEDTNLFIREGYYEANRITTVGNGIDVERFSPDAVEKARRPFPTVSLRLCTTGRLVSGKGLEDLIEATRMLRQDGIDCSLTIVGGNIKQDREVTSDGITALIRRDKLENVVHVTGLVDDVESHLAAADVFVLPSYREGMPRSLLEAMSMGLPCIATRIRGCREIIAHGENGLLYEPKQLGDLVFQIKKLQDPSLRRRLGLKARETVLKRFTETRYVQLQAKVTMRVLSQNQRK
jgi:glycosyltransferase involved in cell wall biosynthesis